MQPAMSWTRRRRCGRGILLTLGVLCASAACPASSPSDDEARKKAEALLKQYLAEPKPAMPMFMSGGGYLVVPGEGAAGVIQCETYIYRVRHFDKWVRDTGEKSATVTALRKLGPATAEACRRALRAAGPGPGAVPHLAMLLGRVGEKESAPALIDFLARCEKGYPAAMTPWKPDHPAATWALWELSGRKLQQSAAGWRRWWEAVGPSFVPARRRQALRVSAEQVAPLVAKLAGNEGLLIRERLAVLGPAAVPHLVEALGSASAKTRLQLAWVLDELGAAKRIPAALRREYFTHRLLGPEPLLVIEKEACRRALAEQAFEDYCRTVVSVDLALGEAGQNTRMSSWMHLNSRVFREAMAGRDAEVAQAVPYLIRSLDSNSKAARAAAVKIAATVGFTTKTRPAALLEALANRWPREPDPHLRYDTLFALSRFDSPVLKRTLTAGLFSARVELLGDCAGVIGWHGRSRLNGEEKAEVDQRLVELIGHPDDRVRRGAVRGLLSRSPADLGPHLPSLCSDPVADVRLYCARLMSSRPAPAQGPLLAELAADPQSAVRRQAAEALEKEAHRHSVRPSQLARALATRDSYTAALLARYIERQGGAEAAAVLVRAVARGSPHSDVRDALARLAGRKLKTPGDALAWWWGHPVPAPAGASKRLTAENRKRLWAKLGDPVGPEALDAVVELAAGGDGTVEFLSGRLAPVRCDANRLPGLIGKMGAADFATRARASEELTAIGPPAGEALRRALAPSASAELRGRIEVLLAALEKPYPATPHARRLARAVRVLERIATPESKRVLRTLARGSQDAFLTRRAGAALSRLATDNRGDPHP